MDTGPRLRIVPGPSYARMRRPARFAPSARDELDPENLFNISWYEPDGAVRAFRLPDELTGTDAAVVVLGGARFPSGSHKVAAVYATLLESEVAGRCRPGEKIVVGPSTGNFGIGTAYVSRLKGYDSLVVMPDSMSEERYARIRRYGGELDLTPGTESDVILTLERTYDAYMHDPRYEVLEQFELLPNYRFHRTVTAPAVHDAARTLGTGRVSAFVSAPGSAGTLAAGEGHGAVIAAVEPYECSTLYDGGQGQHRIEGIGDKMVTFIHNVTATDYVVLVHDDDAVAFTHVLHEREWPFRDQIGVSGAGNILGAVKLARHLGLGRDDTVVTVATDGFDRYPSVITDLQRRRGPLDAATRERWLAELVHAPATDGLLDTRASEQKDRLHGMKVELWKRFRDADYEAMRSQTWWDEEAAKTDAVDDALRSLAGEEVDA